MSETVAAAKPTGAVQPAAGHGHGAAGHGEGRAAAGGTHVAVENPPAWLSALREGEVVSGVVREGRADGRVVIDTPKGVLVLDRPVNAEAGQIVRLQMVAEAAGRVELILLTGQAADARPAQAPGQQTLGPAVALKPGAVITGRFIAAPGQAPAGTLPDAAPPAVANPPSALRALPAGTVLDATVAALRADGQAVVQTAHGRLVVPLPTTAAVDTAVRLQIITAGERFELAVLPLQQDGDAQTHRAALPAVAGRLRGQIQALVTRLGGVLEGLVGHPSPLDQPSTPLSVRVLAVHAPNAPPSRSPQASAHAPTITGTVVSSSAQGLTVVQAESGVFVARTAGEVALGSRVTLEVVAAPGTVLPSTAADMAAQSLQNLAYDWPALRAAVQAIAAADPALAAQITQAALPQTGPRLTTGMLFFLSALFGGRLQDWLGRDALQALERLGQRAILGRLAEDFGQLTRFANEPPGSEWRAVMVPLMHEGELHQLRLYLRRRGADTSEDGEAGTRFVLEAELSRLGPLQLDGLVRGQRFDLIVRSTRALPRGIQEDVRDIFATAGAAANFAGGVTFRVSASFPVAPLDGVDGHALGLFA